MNKECDCFSFPSGMEIRFKDSEESHRISVEKKYVLSEDGTDIERLGENEIEVKPGEVGKVVECEEIHLEAFENPHHVWLLLEFPDGRRGYTIGYVL